MKERESEGERETKTREREREGEKRRATERKTMRENAQEITSVREKKPSSEQEERG